MVLVAWLAAAVWLTAPAAVLAAPGDCYFKLIKAKSPPVAEISSCLRLQSDLFTRHAATSEGARYLYRMGKLNTLLYRATRRGSHFESAVDCYRRLINHYPQSNLADDAQFNIGQVFLQEKGDKVAAYVEFLKVEVNHPQGDMVSQAKARLASLGREIKDKPKAEAEAKAQDKKSAEPDRKTRPDHLPQVTGVRHWSAASYTRVVVDLTGPVEFKAHLLRPDPDLAKPARLYVDLEGARLGSQGEKRVEIADGHLRQARLGQFDGTTVRVVLDIQTIDGYKVFALHSPDRLVIDVTGPQVGAREEGPSQAPDKEKIPSTPPSVHKTPSLPRGPASEEAGPTLATQLGLGVRTVVIDPGHGGRDPGCKTCRADLVEKSITLKVARKLAQKIKKRLGLKVILTRTKDVYLPLEERTAIANTSQADLFISIHVNAARDRSLAGVETYFLNLATDERAIQVAARENATSAKSISDLQAILNDLMMNTKINESNRLAFQTQRQLISSLRKSYSKVRSLGVKQAPFYVLLGAQMPAVLVEIGFGTNRTDCRRLATNKYLDRVAEGISQGVAEYIKQAKGGG
ncbi:MAG: N-acetylmuramoyl-L-alanine amidase [Deltaproteobacteria bacterium]|nr:N-acetylmuramoyl-L-alanine amidase [Deltaproteobacteria bacterium]